MTIATRVRGIDHAQGIMALVKSRSIAGVHPLVPLLILALGLRLVAASVSSTHHPDEIFQYLEPAHRLVFGYGATTWEYRYGIRSWLFPLILSGPMALGNAIAPGGTLYLWLPKLMMVVISLAIPWSGWKFGLSVSRRHAAITALVGAVWGEFVYFAPHTLTETLATAVALAAAALLASPGVDARRRDVVAAGMLIGLAGLFRFQFAPALAIIAIFFCRRRIDRWTWLVAGAAGAALIGAAVDLATGSLPYAWLIENVRQNLLQNRAAQYGTAGPFGYVAWLEHLWGWWLMPIVPLIRVGMRRQPALFWAATANFVLHSLIGHKEYRFIELSSTAFILLAALGSVDLLDRAENRFPAIPRMIGAVGLCVLWLTASLTMSLSHDMRRNWSRARQALAATDLLRIDPDLCGVALYKLEMVDWGGYSHLHRRVPVAYFDAGDPEIGGETLAEMLRQWSPGYNRILAHFADGGELPRGFAQQGCDGDLCIFARPGRCTDVARSPFLLDRVFVRVDRQMRDNIRLGIIPTS